MSAKGQLQPLALTYLKGLKLPKSVIRSRDNYPYSSASMIFRRMLTRVVRGRMLNRNFILLACGFCVGACAISDYGGANTVELYPEVPITKAQQRIMRDEHSQRYASFSSRDLNADGVVDLQEYHLMDWAYRATYDFDEDGLLVWSEFILSRCPIPRNRNGQNSIIQTCVRSSISVFDRLDKDRDSAVSFEEARPLAKSFFDSNDICRDGELRPNEAACRGQSQKLNGGV